MADFLFALGQVLCILGLLYGACLAITYRQEDPEENASTAHIPVDPVTTQVRNVAAATSENRLHRVREDHGITVSSDRDDEGERRAIA